MNEIRTDSSTGAGAGTAGGVGDAGRAGQVADDNKIHYDPDRHKFVVNLDGKPTTFSPLEAVCYVLQNRYVTMSDTVAERTQEMQDQVDRINEANDWLNAIKKAENGDPLEKPGDLSDTLKQWMDKNDIHPDDLGSDTDADDLKRLETEFSNHVDQLSSTNDLKMLKLKTTVNEAQEALTAADGVLQDIKQLMQTITGNMSR